MDAHAKLFAVMIFTILCMSFVPLVSAQAIGRQVSPFDFQLDESAVNGKLYSYIDGPGPAAIIKQNETKSLPVIILSATGKPVLVKFHVTTGNNQIGSIQMPLGVNATVEPSEIMLGYKQNYTIHITVSADKNAPDGKYALNIVGEWPEENGFVGSSIVINIGRDFGPNSMPFNFQWTPLKQFQSGVSAHNVSCPEGFQLIFKVEDGLPACVKPDTASKLVERGWACNTLSHSAHTVISMQTMNVTNSNLSVNYTIINAKILDIRADTRSASITISMQTSGDGNLDMAIPRTLVEYPRSQMDPHLFILGNGQEIDSREINTMPNERTLSIPFKAGINQIEIIGLICCT